LAEIEAAEALLAAGGPHELLRRHAECPLEVIIIEKCVSE